MFHSPVCNQWMAPNPGLKRRYHSILIASLVPYSIPPISSWPGSRPWSSSVSRNAHNQDHDHPGTLDDPPLEPVSTPRHGVQGDIGPSLGTPQCACIRAADRSTGLVEPRDRVGWGSLSARMLGPSLLHPVRRHRVQCQASLWAGLVEARMLFHQFN